METDMSVIRFQLAVTKSYGVQPLMPVGRRVIPEVVWPETRWD